MENRPFRLITSSPVEGLARTLEALLVVASAPLGVYELAEAADDDEARVESALEVLAERFSEGRSGIVLEHVAGGYAFRASREEAQACARLVERPVDRALSQAALETLAVAAYLGPVSRPDLARAARRRGRDRRGRPGRARPADRSGARVRCRRRRPLPDDRALRARLRAREPVAPAAASSTILGDDAEGRSATSARSRRVGAQRDADCARLGSTSVRRGRRCAGSTQFSLA